MKDYYALPGVFIALVFCVVFFVVDALELIPKTRRLAEGLAYRLFSWAVDNVPLPFFQKLAQEKKAREEEALFQAGQERILRLERGKICKEKILERIKNHPKLIKARNKRIEKAKRMRELSGFKERRRHAGTIADKSFFESYTVDLDYGQVLSHRKICPNCFEDYEIDQINLKRMQGVQNLEHKCWVRAFKGTDDIKVVRESTLSFKREMLAREGFILQGGAVHEA